MRYPINSEMTGNFCDFSGHYTRSDYSKGPRMDKIVYTYTLEDGRPVLAVKDDDRSTLDRLRDAIHLPRRSLVEQRTAVRDMIRQALEKYSHELDYTIRPDLEKKLFSSRKYRDVKAGDLASLLKDVEDNAKGLPRGYGRAAFSRSGWNRIVTRAERIITPSNGERPEPRSTWKRVCKQLMDKISGCTPSVVGRLGYGVVAAALFSGLVYLTISFGATAALVGVAGAAGAFVAYKVLQAQNGQKPTVQAPDLAKQFAQAWAEEFERNPSDELAGPRRLMFVSSGERFAMDLIRDLGPAAAGVDTVILHRGILQAFEKLSERQARVEQDKRGMMKVKLDGIKYSAKDGVTELPGTDASLQALESSNKEAAKLVIRLPREDSRPVAVRRMRNNVTWQLADLFEKARRLDHSRDGSLTGYVSVVKLPGGYLAHVFRDDRDLPTFSNMRDIIAALEKKSARKAEVAQNIKALLVKDRAAFQQRLSAAGINVGALTDDDFRIDTKGRLLCNLGFRPDLSGVFKTENLWASTAPVQTLLPAVMPAVMPAVRLAIAAAPDRSSVASGDDSGIAEMSEASSISGTESSSSSDDRLAVVVYRSTQSEEKTRKRLAELVQGFQKGTPDIDEPEQTVIAGPSEETMVVEFPKKKSRVAELKGLATKKLKSMKKALVRDLARQVEAEVSRPARIIYLQRAPETKATGQAPGANYIRA